MRFKIKHLIALNAFAAVVVAFPLFFGILAMLAFLTVVALLILVVGVGFADRRHHADQAAAAERHPHPPADHGRARRRGPVVEQARQRHRQGDAEHGFRGGHGRQSSGSVDRGPGRGAGVDLRRIAVSHHTNDPQVADRKGIRALSTQPVDNFVHESVRDTFWP